MRRLPLSAQLFPIGVLLSLSHMLPLGAATPVVDLRQAAEAFAGAPVALDPRLRPPACAGGPSLAWAGPRAVEIRCEGWRVVAPLTQPAAAAQAERARPLVRRGEPVTVEAGGAGFRVAVEGFAEQAGSAGERVLVRNRATGQRFAAEVRADGTLTLAR